MDKYLFTGVEMKIVAITGSIGCGKTTIANILRKLGFLVYDIDKWTKYIYYKRDFLDVIKTEFPETFFKNEFDKRKLRNLVFGHPEKLKKLENIIHPILVNRFHKIIRRNRANHYSDIVFVDIALLYEMGWEGYFDIVLLADVDAETQKNRVMKRDNVTEEDFNKINNIQIPRKEKIAKADVVIDTGVNFNILRKNIVNIVEDLR